MYNGTYTIQNVSTGEYRTFRVRTQADDAKFAPCSRVVALLRGPDNESDYQGFGFLDDRVPGVPAVRIWKSKASGAYVHYGHMLEYAITALAPVDQGIEEPEATFDYAGRTYKVMLSKRCLRCNRKLTTPESVRRGYGPECAALLGMV